MSASDEAIGATFSVRYQVLFAEMKSAPLIAAPAPAELLAISETPKVVATYRSIPTG